MCAADVACSQLRLVLDGWLVGKVVARARGMYAGKAACVIPMRRTAGAAARELPLHLEHGPPLMHRQQHFIEVVDAQLLALRDVNQRPHSPAPLLVWHRIAVWLA